MKRESLYFVGPGMVEVREEELDEPKGGEVMVRTLQSAISAGTEMLFFHDLVERGIALDIGISCLESEFQYPFKYGYALVGEVESVGPDVPRLWQGQRVFSFHPHESHFCCDLKELVPLPEDITLDDAVFLPSMETAISLVMDGAPQIGEEVVVIGQGVIGLLTTSILSRMPLSRLVTMERYPLRRRMSLELGADFALEAGIPLSILQDEANFGELGADLTFELSGNPDALDYAITVTGFEGRIIVGSWYGRKDVKLRLGGDFHRNRLQMMCSQVSNIQPRLSGRWDKERRLALAWRMIMETGPSRLISDKVRIEEAERAYELIDLHKNNIIQVVLTYE